MTEHYFSGRVFDGTMFSEKTLIFSDQSGLIERVDDGGSMKKPAGSVDISDANVILLPGLTDAHMHLMGARHFDSLELITVPEVLSALRCTNDLKALLKAGFTLVRDLGSKVAPQLRKAVEEGSIEGPTVFTSGRSISQTGGDDDVLRLPLDINQRLSYSIYCDGADECRKAVRTVIRDGANVVKVYASGSLDQLMFEGARIKRQFTVEELKAIVDESHAVGLRVAAHAYGEDAIMNALEAGVDSIEHGVGVTNEVCARMAKQNTFYVPTLSMYEAITPMLSQSVREIIANHPRDVELAAKYGVKIVCGTDYAGMDISPHGQNYMEIVTLSKILGASRAIEAATKTAAECLGFNSGVLAKGKIADIIAVRGAPEKDATALNPKNVVAVFKHGKRVRLD
jgi:imidazolonepropionase-like amidohydrolase